VNALRAVAALDAVRPAKCRDRRGRVDFPRQQCRRITTFPACRSYASRNCASGGETLSAIDSLASIGRPGRLGLGNVRLRRCLHGRPRRLGRGDVQLRRCLHGVVRICVLIRHNVCMLRHGCRHWPVHARFAMQPTQLGGMSSRQPPHAMTRVLPAELLAHGRMVTRNAPVTHHRQFCRGEQLKLPHTYIIPLSARITALTITPEMQRWSQRIREPRNHAGDSGRRLASGRC
jgi:hypothetical protein